jgi:hypothetical protein
MTTAMFTEKQRQAVEAMEGARSEGVALSRYAKAHGLIIRELYDAIACLRRKGLLPPHGGACGCCDLTAGLNGCTCIEHS